MVGATGPSSRSTTLPARPAPGSSTLRPGERAELPWEVGFALHPAARGRGIMSAALRLGARWAFEHGAPSLYWYAARGNLASWRVAHSCGFTHHGTLPQRVPVRHGTADAWCASLLPDDALSPRQPWVVPPVVEADGLRLRPLRDEGVLIIGSGFTTHGLPYLEDPSPGAIPPGWSVEFDGWAHERTAAGDVDALIDFRRRAPGMPYAHPTTEHFAPLFVALGASDDPAQRPRQVIDGFWMGLSKRSFQVA